VNSSSTTGLPRPFPPGIAAEVTPLGVRVTLAARRMSIVDRRIGKVAIMQGGLIFLIFAAFFGYAGAFRLVPHLLPMLIGLAVLIGSYAAVGARARTAKRQSLPATLELVSGRLIVDEQGFNQTRQRRVVTVVPLHIEYALTDLATVTVSGRDDDSPFENALKVRMKNRLSNYHLKGRPEDQLEWTARWLGDVLAKE